MKRILVCVDVSNVYYTMKKKYGSRSLDYRKLQDYCRKRGWVYRAVAYSSDMKGKADDFFNCLRQSGFEVQTKPVQVYRGDNGETREKADWDVGIAIDIVRFMGHYDELVLVCSDGDMIPVVKFCQERGVRVHVLGSNISLELRNVADSHQEIGPSLVERSDELHAATKTA